MEPIEKAVAKALQAKQLAFEQAIGDNDNAIDEAANLIPASQAAAPVKAESALRAPAAAPEHSRREEARRQLFPNDLKQASSAAASHKAEEPTVSDENSAARDEPAQRAPNGSLAMLDPSKMDDLVNQRLQQNPDQRTGVDQDLSPDALNSVRMIDREFSNWERELRADNLTAAKEHQERAYTLLEQIPEAMAKPLLPTMTMLSEQTAAAGQSGNASAGPKRRSEEERERTNLSSQPANKRSWRRRR